MPGSEKEYEYWGKLAKNFHEDNPYVVGPNIYPEVKEWLVDKFNDEDTVLELGCGTEFFTEMIADRVKHVTATDLAPEMIEQARSRLKQYGKPCSYGKNLSPDGLAVLVEEAGFVVEEFILIGKDTKAVCLRGRKVK